MGALKKGGILNLVGLYILTIPFFNALNVTTYDNSQILGHFGASTTVFAYCSYIPFFAMITFIPLGLKIGKQIPLRTLILSASFLSILFNTASLYSINIFWFTFWRSLVAIISVTGIFASMIPIILKYNPAFNMPIMYGIIQFILQGSQHLYKFFGAKFTSIHNWTFGIYFLNINFLVCILLAWYFYKKDLAPMKAKFQFDWRGWLILIFFLALILFLCAEGQTRNWFSDPKIGIAVAFLLIIVGIYLIHVRFTKEPLINTDVFKYKNVVIGSLLFFYTGLMNGTGSVVTGYMSGVLGFDAVYQAKIHLAILIGLFIAIPLSTYLLYKRIYLATIWIAGFACYGMFHIILFFRFYPGITATDFLLPLIFKGLAIGFLYPISALYISEGVPKNLGDSRMMSGVISRIVFATMLGGAILGTHISNVNIHHKTGLSQQLSSANQQAQTKLLNTKYYYLHQGLSEVEAQKMAEKSLSNQTSQASILLAYKDIYLVMSAICFLPIIILLLFGLGRRPIGRVELEPIPF
ncbi:MFS transporter, DHA2 family, multidrug resistance protein [Flavobacterium fluvii]|uniref:MFS transporter, DHA2 family, multidrug resistance protein n=1 Tax=Flavobacterium fluvii TaxID=468056 RepID=A0A1M5M6Y5_9FLAO|nr:MFS transporter [Flavobacterium fluvii]SHG73064.1 MFS transporter, DHA2 family, multidrug resistance protein [Flavobacterium fluvii]